MCKVCLYNYSWTVVWPLQRTNRWKICPNTLLHSVGFIRKNSKILPRYPTMQMDVVNPGLKKIQFASKSLWTKDQILLMYASFAQVTNNLLVQCKDFKTCWLAAIFFYHKSMLSSTSEIWLFKEFTILFTTGLNFKIIKFIIDNDFH